MNIRYHSIASIFDSKFQGKLDDTLINRLCRSIVCQHEFHMEFWSTIPINLWHLISEHASRWNDSCDYTVELHVILKAAVSLSFRYGLIFGDKDGGPQKIVLYALNLTNKNVYITLIEALSNCLKSIVSIKDVSTVSWVMSPKVLEVLQNLSKETNIHVSRNTIYVCAFIFLQLLLDNKFDTSQKPLDECFRLSPFGTEILFVTGELIQKFGVKLETLKTADECQFSVTTYNLFPPELQVKLLYLVFTGVISSPSSNTDWILFLKSLHNFPELCAAIITYSLKRNTKLCSEIWKFITGEWSLSLHKCLEDGKADNVLRIINPICLCSSSSLHLESGSVLLKKIVTVIIQDSNFIRRTDAHKYHTKLWILSRILVRSSPHSAISLSDVSDIVNYLVSHLNTSNSDSLTSKVESAFAFFKEICLLYWDSKQSFISKLIYQLFDSLLTCWNLRIFSMFSFYFIHLTQDLSSKYDFLEVYGTFWTCFYKLLSKVHDHILNQSPISLDVLNNEGLLEIAASVLKILSCKAYISLWTSECRSLFYTFINNLVSELGISSFINDVFFRGLTLSTFILFIMYERQYNSINLELKNCVYSSEWARKSYDYLADFDIMGLTESKYISKTLWDNISYLEKEYAKYPIDLWKYILSSIKEKWMKNLGEDYLLSIQESSVLNYCPNCRENIEELLDDIITSSTSNIFVDCTEG
ncbi:hypothetical protein MN116_005719 [Schistosoma mekongi]|uniref:Uncharacterized protein n=1 Tax=Schistosoma mekongi TaxID=38744 RepID=A0AAE1Z9N6_SCHME|nr:hypothetical protein MN116_005719 [Schistosoma mekongi]